MQRRQPLLVIATDCGGTDRGRYEIAASRSFQETSPTIAFFETESMNTLHAGFIAAAHALSTIDHFGPLRGDERIGLLVNAAPRHGKENGHKLRGQGRKNEGEEIYALTLDNGVKVVGPNAGMNFYFIDRNRIRESYLLTGPGLDTPFRSMEFMVPALGRLLGENDFPIELTPKELAVPIPEKGIFVADWDRHGNIYLFSNQPDDEWVPPLEESVCVKINKKVALLQHVDGIFAGRTGGQTLTTGSLKLNGKPVYYIVVVGSDARGQLGNPEVGTPVYIEG